MKIICQTCRTEHEVERTIGIPDSVTFMRCNWCPNCEDRADTEYREWYGRVPKPVNPKQRRRHKLHYKLRKRGNTVVTRTRTVTKRSCEVSETEQRWLRELMNAGYCVCDRLF